MPTNLYMVTLAKYDGMDKRCRDIIRMNQHMNINDHKYTPAQSCQNVAVTDNHVTSCQNVTVHQPCQDLIMVDAPTPQQNFYRERYDQLKIQERAKRENKYQLSRYSRRQDYMDRQKQRRIESYHQVGINNYINTLD